MARSAKLFALEISTKDNAKVLVFGNFTSKRVTLVSAKNLCDFFIVFLILKASILSNYHTHGKNFVLNLTHFTRLNLATLILMLIQQKASM